MKSEKSVEISNAQKIMGDRKIGSSRLKKRESFIDFLTVVPALVYFCVFTYYPLIYLFNISFTNWNLTRPTYKYVGTTNWEWVFGGNGWATFVDSLKTTALYTLGELFWCLIVGLSFALIFDRVSKWFNVMRTAIVLPKYISSSSASVIFIWMMDYNHGLFNYIIESFGGEKIRFLASVAWALPSVLLLTGWKTVGYAMIIYLSAMRGIPQDYYEAASIDGAGAIRQFTKITAPLLAPTMLFLGVTQFLSSMKIFQTIDVMTGGGPYGETNVVVFWIYDLAFKQFRVDRAAVVGCAFFVILLFCTSATMKWSNKSVNYDA